MQRICRTLVGFLIFQFAAVAQDNSALKQLHAYRIRGEAPRIDGNLNDEVWINAEAIEDFVQGEPENLAAPTERTVVKVAYDDRNLYVAVHCYVQNASQISAGLGRRDNFPPSDRIAILLDPRHDKLTGYVFQTNPSGVQGDYTLFDDTSSSFDYDGVWDVDTAVGSDGWTAEFQIPMSQMRFTMPETGEAVWGFNVQRDIYGKGEWDRWISNARGVRANVSRFGELIFAERFSPPRRLEVLPFTLGRLERLPSSMTNTGVDVGFDLRYGIGTSATLSATVNPDFGQVEQDPAVLNLSVFETQFQEKRPFFLEDSRIFVLPYNQFPDFYSPRIGRAPGRFALPKDEKLVSKPERTRILTAVKLTGKSSGWTYGGLTALTAREYATIERGDGTRGERLIEPRTSFNIGRLQRDIRGTSNVGLVGTAVIREKDLDAYTGGVDANIRWAQNRFVWNGHAVGTNAPISGVQRKGYGGATNFSFLSRKFGINGHFDQFSRYFRNQDMGFFNNRSNKTDVNGGFNLIQPEPWSVFRNMNFFAGYDQAWTGDDNLLIQRSINTNFFTQFLNFWNASVNYSRNFQVYSDLNTRGGPPIVIPAGHFMGMNINSDSRKSWGAGFFLNSNRDSEGGWNTNFGPNLRLQPSARLQASLSVTYNPGLDIAQWIKNTDVTGDGVDDNVFGRLRRNVVDIRARGTYAFSRTLTLEAYIQPFVSVGRYTDIKRLARAKSFDFESASLADNPDFNNKSLRSNVVFRWEYQRGSTVYFVWQMSGSDSSNAGVFSPGRDLRDAFSVDRTHVFMIKTNYWLGL